MQSETNSNQSLDVSPGNKFPIVDLWYKYEKIAMHFNELILKIRVQALAVVAAISAIVGLLSKTVSDNSFSWKIMIIVFFFLMLFWIAIWILDFMYYNRLLSGAVRALLKIEHLSKNQSYISDIDLSSMIEDAVAGEKYEPVGKKRKESHGRWWFYWLVFVALIFGFLFSMYKAYGFEIINMLQHNSPT